MATSAIELLDPYLASDGPRENGDWDAYCPVHDDRRRSATINFEEGVWFCHAENDGGTLDELLARIDDWIPRPARNGSRPEKTSEEGPASELPSEDEIKRWNRALTLDFANLEALKANRGLWTKTVDYFEIGWDESANAYTIPIRDATGALLNVRRYTPRPYAGRRKIWGIRGHNAAVLYPLSGLRKAREKGEAVIVCEGEFDALVLNQQNYRAITRTGAAGIWKPAWSKEFEGLVVYVCHDCDSAGQKANRKVARSLLKYAKEVRTLRLPYPIAPKNGKDITDWWLEHDLDKKAFSRLLEEAQLFDESMDVDPEEIDPSESAVIDAFDSAKSGKPLALTVTVKGKNEPGYTIPRKVEFRCTQDMGKKCEICPMKVESGAIDRVIAGADPDILELVESTRAQVGEILRRAVGIPKCPKLNIMIPQHQAVEVLYARPSVDHSNGQGNSDYKNIKFLSVGRHDTFPNQTVRIVGALHPDPRRQLNAFLAWEVSRMETSLDRFEMDLDTYRELCRFQPKTGQAPLAKLRDIADDLAQHVTKIYGRPEMHAAMDLVFHSVIGFDFDGKRLGRGWLELLVAGDTRTGKSEAAVRIRDFYSAGEVISCESATFAGIVGGLQQIGSNREWAVTWGGLPTNDRRLVVLDEISGLTTEEISSLSSIRSSGIAELTKIQQERTYARTRLIWLGNPRSGRMDDYTYGVQVISPLIGNPEDVARFDLAMTVNSSDVPADDINRPWAPTPQRYRQAAAATLLRWVWSRTPDQVIWDSKAVKDVYRAANALGTRYIEDPPLVQAANVREKLARVAAAIAARLFSTDERAELILVRRGHVHAAVRFIDHIYNMTSFGYAERSMRAIDDRRAATRPENIDGAKKILKANPGLADFLRSQGKFRRQDLEEILEADREMANSIISELYRLKMIRKDRSDVLLTPTMHTILREKR